MTARLTCPYCSHEFAPAKPVALGGRTVCPRCGESFTATAFADGEPPATVTDVPGSDFRPFVVPAVLGATLFVLVFSVGTYSIFNGNTNRGPRDAAVAPDGETPEAAAARRLDRDFGFLSPEVNAVVGLHPGDAPGELTTLLQTLGVPPKTVTDTLDKIGVEPEQVRSLVAGFTVLPDNPIPRVVVVLTLREVPADTRKILTGFAAKRDPKGPGDQRYAATVNQVPFALRVVDPRTYLLALDARDIDRAPTPGRDHFTAGLRESLARWPAGAKAGLATSPEDWARQPLVTFLALAVKQPDLAARLAGVRAVAATAGDGSTVRLEVRAADAPTAARLAEALAPAEVAGDWVTTTGPGRTLLDRLASKR